MNGKNFGNKKKLEDRPPADYYCTPKSLIWEIEDIILSNFNKDLPILEPADGTSAVSEELIKYGYNVITNDIRPDTQSDTHIDYLNNNFNDYTQVITNPPFSLWDQFIYKAKEHCTTFLMLGKTEFMSAHGRNINGLWKNLKCVLIMDRMVDFQTPKRTDGYFHVGMIHPCWYLWDMSYTGDATIKIIDVNKYAKIGGFDKFKKCKCGNKTECTICNGKGKVLIPYSSREDLNG